MASTAVQETTISVRAFPQISKETRDRMSQERKRLAADPSGNQPPADLTIDSTYIFRTRPNTFRQFVWNLPMPPEEANSKTPAAFEFAKRTWARIVAQPAYPDLKREDAVAALTKRVEDLRDRIGDTKILFDRVPRHVESVFATDDAVVAAYCRELMEAGKPGWDKVYEQSGKSRIVVGETAFPNNKLGRELAFAHMAEHGGELTIVKE